MSTQSPDSVEAGAASAPPATPYIRIDEATLLANLRRMADYTARHGLGLRPHAKTHKSLHLAGLQLELGAVGLTVAKVSEAETLSAVCDDLLLAYPVVDGARAQVAATLSKRSNLMVAIDSEHAALVLSQAGQAAGSQIGILVDLDVGPHRTGVPSPAAAVDLMQTVERSAGLTLRGLFCYPGQIWDGKEHQGPALRKVAETLQETIDLAARAGLNTKIVSGGSTPTAFQSHLVPQLTEIRPGTYPYNDMNTVHGGYCELDDCAARVVVTVISDAVPGQVVIDAGSKTLTSDRCVPRPDAGHGQIVQYPDARIFKLSEEHGQVDFSGCPTRPPVGEQLTVIPNHICPCINLQDSVWLASRDGALRKMSIEARGKLW